MHDGIEAHHLWEKSKSWGRYLGIVGKNADLRPGPTACWLCDLGQVNIAEPHFLCKIEIIGFPCGRMIVKTKHDNACRAPNIAPGF